MSSAQALPILFDELHIEALPHDKQTLLWQIDALLPQTQCGLCGYKDGCLPYAYAITTQGEATNLCVPGGDDTAKKIASLTNTAPKSAAPSKWSTDPATGRPIEVRAIIDESACIGCTKCIPACPVDAIIGTAKHMHSIMTALCTGCELCVAPCPVDCISIAPYPRVLDDTKRQQEQDHLRQRYHSHLNRLSQAIASNRAIVVSHTQSKLANLSTQNQSPISTDNAQKTIALAKLRSQIKKLEKQLGLGADPNKENALISLKAQMQALEDA